MASMIFLSGQVWHGDGAARGAENANHRTVLVEVCGKVPLSSTVSSILELPVTIATNCGNINSSTNTSVKIKHSYVLQTSSEKGVTPNGLWAVVKNVSETGLCKSYHKMQSLGILSNREAISLSVYKYNLLSECLT